MGMEIPFDVANIPGPEMGEVAPPEVIGNYISSAKRPLLVVGSEILRDDFFLEIAIEIGKKGIPIAATGHSIRGFVEKGYITYYPALITCASSTGKYYSRILSISLTCS